MLDFLFLPLEFDAVMKLFAVDVVLLLFLVRICVNGVETSLKGCEIIWIEKSRLGKAKSLIKEKVSGVLEDLE